MNTYPAMDAKIVGILRLTGEPAHLYAAQRIEELERERDAALALAERRAEEIEGMKETVKRLERKYAVLETMPWLGRVTGVGGEPKSGEHIARIRFRDATVAGRGADGEASE